MSTHTQMLVQIVFATYKRQAVLTKNNRNQLYKYIWGILQNKKCHLYQIGGVEDHIHMLTSIHPTVAIAALVKDIKVASAKFIKDNNLFTQFTAWQEGYGVFSYSMENKEELVSYVKNQEQHHTHKTFAEEYRALLMEHDIEFDEKYLL